MRILGINIRKMDSMIQKNLLEGWFPLGDYPAPTDNGYVLLDPETEEKRNKAMNCFMGFPTTIFKELPLVYAASLVKMVRGSLHCLIFYSEL